MKGRNYLYYSSNSIDKHIQATNLNSFRPKEHQQSFLKETQDNLSSLIATIKPNQTLNNSTSSFSDKRQSYSNYLIETENTAKNSGSKSTLISEISNRLTHLETKLNSYQAKADGLRNSYQKSIDHPSLVTNDRYLLANPFPLDSPTIKRNIQFSPGNIEDEVKDLKQHKQKDLINIEQSPLMNNQIKLIEKNNICTPNQLMTQTKEKEKEERLNNQKLLDKISFIKQDNNKTKMQVKTMTEEMSKTFSLIITSIDSKIKKEQAILFKEFKAKATLLIKDKKRLMKDLKSVIEEKKVLTKEVQKYKNELETVSNQLYKVKEDNIKYITEIKAKFEPQIKALQSTIKDLHNQLETTKEELMQIDQTHQCKITLLESRINQSTMEGIEAKSELMKTQNELTALKEANKKISKNLESKGGQIFTSKSKIEMLAKQVKYKEGQISDLLTKSESISHMNIENELKYKRELSVKTKEMRTIREKGDKVLKQKTQIEIDNKSLFMKNEKLIKEKTKLEDQVNQMSDLIKKNKTDCEGHTNNLFLVQEEINGYKNEIDKLRSLIQENDKRDKEFEEYKSNMSRLMENNEQEIKCFKKTLEVINHKHIIDISADKSEKEKKKKKIALKMPPLFPNDAKLINSKNESRSRSLSEQCNTSDKQEDEYEESEKEMHDEKRIDTITQNKDENDNENSKNNPNENDNESKEEKNQTDLTQQLKIEIEELIKENEELSNKYTQEKNQLLSVHQKEKEELLKQNIKLNNQLIEANEAKNQYMSDYSLIEIELTQSKNLISELESTNQEKIEVLTKELNAAKEELINSQLNDENDNLFLNYQNTIDELKKQNAVLQTPINNQSTINTDCFELNKEIDGLKKEKENLLEDIKKAKLKLKILNRVKLDNIKENTITDNK